MLFRFGSGLDHCTALSNYLISFFVLFVLFVRYFCVFTSEYRWTPVVRPVCRQVGDLMLTLCSIQPFVSEAKRLYGRLDRAPCLVLLCPHPVFRNVLPRSSRLQTCWEPMDATNPICRVPLDRSQKAVVPEGRGKAIGPCLSTCKITCRTIDSASHPMVKVLSNGPACT